MELTKAKDKAEGLAEAMRPYCLRVEIAGSIRRRKEGVKDIELVAVPKWELAPVEEQVRDLFGSPPRAPENFNLLHFWATKLARGQGVHWIKPATSEIVTWTPKPDGKYWRAIVGDMIKLDLFLARPENFGLIYLIRTGSAEFSQGVVTHAKYNTRYRVMEGNLVTKDGESVTDTPEERGVFELLGLDYVEPGLRAGQHMVMRGGRAIFPRKADSFATAAS